MTWTIKGNTGRHLPRSQRNALWYRGRAILADNGRKKKRDKEGLECRLRPEEEPCTADKCEKENS